MDAYSDHDRVIECFYLKEFYNTLPEYDRPSVQDGPGVDMAKKEAKYAEEYVARRGSERDRVGERSGNPSSEF